MQFMMRTEALQWHLLKALQNQKIGQKHTLRTWGSLPQNLHTTRKENKSPEFICSKTSSVQEPDWFCVVFIIVTAWQGNPFLSKWEGRTHSLLLWRVKVPLHLYRPVSAQLLETGFPSANPSSGFDSGLSDISGRNTPTTVPVWSAFCLEESSHSV